MSLVKWEELTHSFNSNRVQDSFNEKLLECDILLCLFYKKVGIHTKEELYRAVENLKEGKNPKYIYVFFKKPPIDDESFNAIQDFKEQIIEAQQMYNEYTYIDNLLMQFGDQLSLIIPRYINEMATETPKDLIINKGSQNKHHFLFLKNTVFCKYLRIITAILIIIILGTSCLYVFYKPDKSSFIPMATPSKSSTIYPLNTVLPISIATSNLPVKSSTPSKMLYSLGSDFDGQPIDLMDIKIDKDIDILETPILKYFNYHCFCLKFQLKIDTLPQDYLTIFKCGKSTNWFELRINKDGQFILITHDKKVRILKSREGVPYKVDVGKDNDIYFQNQGFSVESETDITFQSEMLIDRISPYKLEPDEAVFQFYGDVKNVYVHSG